MELNVEDRKEPYTTDHKIGMVVLVIFAVSLVISFKIAATVMLVYAGIKLFTEGQSITTK